MYERILLMGSPGSGKSTQLLHVYDYVTELGVPMFLIDAEDKLGAMLEASGRAEVKPYVAFDMEGLDEAAKQISEQVKPGNWLGIDRVDLIWAWAQRWYTQQKYDEDLASHMLQQAKSMKAKSSRYIPRFDQGAWQVINERYESMFLKLFYQLRCNVILTSGIRSTGQEESPKDIFATLDVMPRGQKELGHQPHSVFLLEERRKQHERLFFISTGKDLSNRGYFFEEPLFDFSLQYLDQYYKK